MAELSPEARKALAAYDGPVTVCPPRTLSPDEVTGEGMALKALGERGRRVTARQQKFKRAAENARRRREHAPAAPALTPVRPLELKDQAAPPGPPPGALELLPPVRLGVDPAYQRGISRRGEALIRRIAQGFDWGRFGVLVARRGPALLYELIDGQHRAIAALSLGLPAVPVWVIAPEVAAGAYLGLNRDRVIPDPCQLFHAEVAAGDPEARDIAGVLEGLGVSVLKKPPRQAAARDGLATRAIAAIRRVHRAHGPAGLEAVLGVVADADNEPDRLAAVPTIQAVAEVYAALAAEPGCDLGAALDRLAGVLATGAAGDWHARARDAAARHGGPAWRHLARLLANELGRRGGPVIAIGV